MKQAPARRSHPWRALPSKAAAHRAPVSEAAFPRPQRTAPLSCLRGEAAFLPAESFVWARRSRNKGTCCSLRASEVPAAAPLSGPHHPRPVLTGCERRVIEGKTHKFQSSPGTDIMNLVQHIFLDQRCL